MASLLGSTLNTRLLPATEGRFLRSDCPARITDDEVAWLREKGFTTVVDLREPKEYLLRPCRLETEAGFAYYHLPVTGGGDPPATPAAAVQAYRRMADDRMEEILRTLLEAPGRALFFCTAGKDRTGVVAALLLQRLGISRRVILEDYLASRENLLPGLQEYVKAHPQVSLETLLPREEYLQGVLERNDLP